MTRRAREVTPPPEVLAYYAGSPEKSRLGYGSCRLEFERTKEILARVLSAAPARIVDVGGAAGAYSSWLAEQGYEVTSRRRLSAPGGGGADAKCEAAISRRYASALDGLARRLSLDPRFVKIRDRDLADGQHRNDTDNADYFTTAYFHRPDDLHSELEVVGFRDVRVLGVEGPAWMLPDFDARWENAAVRKDLLDVARALESEPAVVGVSAHLLGIARRP